MRATLFSALLLFAAAAQAGGLTPPGAPAPTMVTLDQLDAAVAGTDAAADAATAAGNAAETAALAAQDVRVDILSLPGDAASEHAISASGSYYLTGDIVGTSGRSGILINADNVTIDLNGFELRGVAGSLFGVNLGSAAFRRNVAIRNGRARDWPSGGIGGTAAPVGIVLQGLVLANNGANGASVGSSAVATDCAFLFNGASGIVGSGTLQRCVAHGNGVDGFSFNGAVSDCVAASNATGFAGSGSFRYCSASSNTSIGFSIFDGSIENCSAASNGGDGIRLLADCVAKDNACTSNGTTSVGAGIHATGQGNRIEGNLVASNDNGIDCDAQRNVVIRNAARANTDNYGQIVALNDVGPIGTAAASTSPFANLSF